MLCGQLHSSGFDSRHTCPLRASNSSAAFGPTSRRIQFLFCQWFSAHACRRGSTMPQAPPPRRDE